MSIALLITDRNLDDLKSGIEAALKGVVVTAWPNIDKMADAEFVVVWKQPQSIWAQLPKAKVICSLGAGVDGLISDPFLPQNVDVVRIVDDRLSEQMADYILSLVLLKNLQLDVYIKQQQNTLWQPQSRFERKNIALLGVGKIGQCVGRKLLINGFNVNGWARANRPNVDFEVQLGQEGLVKVLADADYIVSTLPATPETDKIINKNLFELMPNHACFINAGRGQTVNEIDLISALADNQIGSAVLDVFQQEPLPQNHQLWSNDRILITPHIAAITDQKQVVQQIVRNYLAYQSKQALENKVNIKLGY